MNDCCPGGASFSQLLWHKLRKCSDSAAGTCDLTGNPYILYMSVVEALLIQLFLFRSAQTGDLSAGPKTATQSGIRQIVIIKILLV